MKRIAGASLVGTAIEYYDFYVYGTAAALVFPAVFFPGLSPTSATIASLATFAVAFVSRPVGAAVFGYFGDRLGRKKTLVATLLIAGSSTVAIGALPSAADVGVIAPCALLVLRLVQGFGVGGEWAGSALLAAEFAPSTKRGLFGMFTQLGVGTGLVASNLVFLTVNLTVGEQSPLFLSWGWRLPFLFSAVLIVVALYVRLTVEETPVFVAMESRHRIVRAPLRELLRRQRTQVMWGTGVMVGVFTFSFMGGTYLAAYAGAQLHHPRSLILLSGVIGGLAMMALTVVSAIASDGAGRRRVILVGFAVAVPWSFVVLPMLNTGAVGWYVAGITGTFAILGISYGPMASFIPEIFSPQYRYTAAGLVFNLAGILGGAVPPLVAGALLASWGPWAIGVLMAALVGISLVSTVALPETADEPLPEGIDDRPVASPAGSSDRR